MALKKILVVFGTRPEAIKMAPLVLKLQQHTATIETKVCVTAQHREMLDQVLDIFGITPDYDLNIMKKDQDLYSITADIVTGMKYVIATYKPDMVCVHGDTTTAFMSALSAFYAQIPVAHIEAGLRSGDIYSPWPEEANRKLISSLATLNFVPTATNRDNLLRENTDAETIHITGNSVIDALFWILDKLANSPGDQQRAVDEIRSMYDHFADDRRFVLITGHRRENFGEGFIQICQAIATLAERYPDTDFVYPVHLNPHVQKPVYKLLGELSNVYLIDPMQYESFVYLMSKAYFVLTDSGGIQEEAPSLGKPVLVMRNTTERPEALELGTVKLVGTDSETIIREASVIFDDPKVYQKMSKAANPYGDGTAAEKIVKVLMG